MQFNEIIKNSKKIVTVNDLINNIELITDVIKEDILIIAKAKKIYFADFDFTYGDAVALTPKSITFPF
ncbi:hypothetical protein CP985_14155 [Malaciobacter mytili LMG 24559]|uniref:UDP-3-O-(3-hydroxymyristoyl)glucosamine N-acyltransferase n=1 Tax=Malaciobacter mytili LMG 24559 TaxID=1032238 RepID=A0AAX2ADQ9_9BACT|nr:hypothetical protein [Malaciobacter mytili]AXH16471.1 hypothetical protein AMYT_a0173 [Malaciobacter mytili LMG 24559]RXK12890.1 hypothetical protein CP985_14155 [Malaciobacter mytili LMG 24559]